MSQAEAVAARRVYEKPKDDDGLRVLVDRLWPRGMSRERLQADLWLKDVAPSSELRRFFHRHREDWEVFRKEYLAELEENAAASRLLDLARQGPVTLLYASRDEEHNHALVLKEFLLNRLGR
jgi:uncharacterized protein YeaO (DUF488 family)